MSRNGCKTWENRNEVGSARFCSCRISKDHMAGFLSKYLFIEKHSGGPRHERCKKCTLMIIKEYFRNFYS